MRAIELIFDRDCPNAEVARQNLGDALVAAGLPPRWTERDRADPDGPPHVQRFGSPTILIDGRDVAGQDPTDGTSSCRLYATGSGQMSGVPPIELIAAALGDGGGKKFQWRGVLSVVPGFGASFLPVGLCPACWPAYAGVLGSLGLGSLLKTTYLLPLTGAFFGLALFGLAYRAGTRRGYRPFGLGLAGATTALVGKFAISQDVVLYLGLALLLTASVWNSWPRKSVVPGHCAKCTPQDLEVS